MCVVRSLPSLHKKITSFIQVSVVLTAGRNTMSKYESQVEFMVL